MSKTESDVIERIKSVAGQDFDAYGCRVRNPHVTARQSIEVANYIVELEKERDQLAAQVERVLDYVKRGSPWNTNTDKCERIKVLSETPPAALAALKAQWQAEAMDNLVEKLKWGVVVDHIKEEAASLEQILKAINVLSQQQVGG